ncbi:MAG: hypothetical protein QXW12_03515 [Nitrososphaerota archaeon]
MGRYALVVILAFALIASIFSTIPAGVSAQPMLINFQIEITTSGGVNRFFTVSAGDTLVQVVNPIYSVSTSILNNAMLTTRESFIGTVSGDLTGTLTEGTFNTIWVDITQTSMRGLTVGHAHYSDSHGAIDLIMILDVEAILSGNNIVGASLKGYAFSKSTTGAYASKEVFTKLEGSLTGANKWSFTGRGWIFNEAQGISKTFDVSGSRESAPGNTRTLNLQTGDTIVQFTRTDITLDSSASAEFTTKQKLTGSVTGGITGSFTIDSNALIITSGTYSGKGFSIARFAFEGSPDTIDGFLILDNTNFGQHDGFIVSVSGTGIFKNKILIGEFQGTFTGPPNYYGYQGTGDVRIYSIPYLVGGEIVVVQNNKLTSGILTTLWIYGATLIVLAVVAMMIFKKRK